MNQAIAFSRRCRTGRRWLCLSAAGWLITHGLAACDDAVPVVPEAPVITMPADGSLINDASLEVRGTGPDDTTVTLFEGNSSLGVAEVEAGRWSLTARMLEEGAHIFTATATDSSGRESVSSEPVTFTVDTIAPEAPVITAPSSGTTVHANTFGVRGTAGDDSTVELFDTDGTTSIGTATAYRGTWTMTTDYLDEGPHSITARATDPAGNTGPDSTAVTVIIDARRMDPPSITTPADSTVTNDTTPVLHGTSEAGSVIELFDTDGITSLGTATADADGNWILTSATMSEGEHTLTATATDSLGGTSLPSLPLSITIDTTPPAAPIIDEPADGNLTNISISAIVGTGEPGAAVQIYDGGEPIDTTALPVRSTGEWYAEVDQLSDGIHELTATVTDAASNVSAPSAAVSVTIDTTAPDEPVIESPADGAHTNDDSPVVTGTADDGTSIELFVGSGDPVGTTTADDGEWSISVPALDDGTYSVTASSIDAAGNRASSSIYITVDTIAPDPPVIVSPVDTVSGFSGPFVITGTAELGATVEVFENDGVTSLGTTDAGIGGWQVTTPTLDEGVHDFTATATDLAGNVSEPSAVATFYIDVTPPVVSVGPDIYTNTTVVVSPSVDDLTNLTYQWTDTGSTGNVVFGAETGRDTTITAAVDGTYTITLLATDEVGRSAFDQLKFVWDTASPALESSSPSPDAVNIDHDTEIRLAFSEPMDTSTFAGNISLDGGAVAGAITALGDRVAVFTPAVPLAPDSTFAVAFTADITDLAGNPVAAGGWSFTTAAAGLPTVEPYYPTNGAGWNDYVRNDGADRLGSSGTACDGTEVGGYTACVHAGEIRTIDTGVGSCANLVAADALGIFDWTCDDSGVTAVMTTSGFKSDRSLPDLLDFNTAGWAKNALTVTDTSGPADLFTTALTEWWPNPVEVYAGGSLAVVGAVYVVNTEPTAESTIDAGKIALVVAPGMSLRSSEVDATALVSATDQDFLWLEGSFDGQGYPNAAIYLEAVGFSSLRNLEVSNSVAGVYLAGSANNDLSNIVASQNSTGVLIADGSSDNVVSTFHGSGNGSGVRISSSSDNTLTDIVAHNGGTGVRMLYSADNTLSGIDAAGNQQGVMMYECSNNVLDDLYLANSEENGFYLEDSRYNAIANLTAINSGHSGVYVVRAAHNSFSQVTVANGGDRGIFLNGCDDSSFSNLTTVNNEWTGLTITTASNNVFTNVVSAGNRNRGLSIGEANDCTFANITAVHNTDYGLALGDAQRNTITGILTVGNNGSGDCYVDLESWSGYLADDAGDVDEIHDGLCLARAPSDFALNTGVSVAASFVGKIGVDAVVDDTDDSVNLDDDASPGIVEFASVTDWTSFENAYRGWGRDGDFPTTGFDRRWESGTGRIWDWSAVGSDSVIRGVLTLPTGDDTITHRWSDTATVQADCDLVAPGSVWDGVSSCDSTFLRNAVEIDTDGVGNDDGLCETGEICWYTPNTGSYQGHGALQSAGAFVDGAITGVTLMELSNNGY